MKISFPKVIQNCIFNAKYDLVSMPQWPLVDFKSTTYFD